MGVGLGSEVMAQKTDGVQEHEQSCIGCSIHFLLRKCIQGWTKTAIDWNNYIKDEKIF